jgi:LPS export ABC transporter protein LptC
VAVAAALAAIVTSSCGGQTPAPAPSPSPKPTAASYEFHGQGTATQPVKLQNIEGGRTIYDLNATDVFYSTSSSKGRFLNDRITFYRASTVRLTITAPVGDVDRVTYDFALHGGVTAVSPRGIRLTSDEMDYNGSTHLLTAIGHVRAIDSQGDVLVGDKAVSDVDLQNIHMSGDVRIGQQR